MSKFQHFFINGISLYFPCCTFFFQCFNYLSSFCVLPSSFDINQILCLPVLIDSVQPWVPSLELLFVFFPRLSSIQVVELVMQPMILSIFGSAHQIRCWPSSNGVDRQIIIIH